MEILLNELRDTAAKLEAANPLTATGLAKKAFRETLATLEALAEKQAAMEASLDNLLRASQGRSHG